MDEVPRGSRVSAEVVLSSVWFVNNCFGVSLTIEDLTVWPEPAPQGFEAFAFE